MNRPARAVGQRADQVNSGNEGHSSITGYRF